MDVLTGNPTDWPNDFKELQDIDNSLRCPICYEYMNTAMMVPKCSHTYCSLCIRRYICYKTQCPTCLVGVSEPELVNNRIIDDILVNFKSVRNRLYDVVKKSVTITVCSDQVGQGHHPRVEKKEPDVKKTPAKTTDSVNRKSKSSAIKSSQKTNRSQPKRKSRNKSRYFDSSDTDNEQNNSDSDVILCSDQEDMESGGDSDYSEDEDFVKSKRGKGKKKNTPGKKHLPQSTKTSKSKTPLSKNKNESNEYGGEETSVGRDYSSGKPVSSLPIRTESQVIKSPPSKTWPIKSPPPTKVATTTPQPGASQPSSSQMSSPSDRVDCPVCGVNIPSKHINLHLDRCLNKGGDVVAVGPAPKRKTLPKLVYSLMADKEIRKRLGEVGLPTQGDRQTLIKRHQEFTLLYNSECDSVKPKSAQQIVEGMNRQEQSKKKMVAMNSFKEKFVTKGASNDEVEERRKTYVNQHKNQFADLIAQAKKRMQNKKSNESGNSTATVTSVTATDNKDLSTVEDQSTILGSSTSQSVEGSETPEKPSPELPTLALGSVDERPSEGTVSHARKGGFTDQSEELPSMHIASSNQVQTMRKSSSVSVEKNEISETEHGKHSTHDSANDKPVMPDQASDSDCDSDASESLLLPSTQAQNNPLDNASSNIDKVISHSRPETSVHLPPEENHTTDSVSYTVPLGAKPVLSNALDEEMPHAVAGQDDDAGDFDLFGNLSGESNQENYVPGGSQQQVRSLPLSQKSGSSEASMISGTTDEDMLLAKLDDSPKFESRPKRKRVRSTDSNASSGSISKRSRGNKKSQAQQIPPQPEAVDDTTEGPPRRKTRTRTKNNAAL